jgi:LemA protein
MKFTTILIVIVAVVALWAVVAYNRFVAMTNRVKEAWADIDVQLKRRYDLIPNLIETVKGYAAQEQEVFQKVTEARSKAMQAGSTAEHADAENMLSGTLKSLFAVSEAYPDLKSNQNFLELQRELSDTENKIQAARRFYNGNVRDLNISVESFPSNMIAKAFGFKPADLFDLAEGDVARENVAVKF